MYKKNLQNTKQLSYSGYIENTTSYCHRNMEHGDETWGWIIERDQHLSVYIYYPNASANICRFVLKCKNKKVDNKKPYKTRNNSHTQITSKILSPTVTATWNIDRCKCNCTEYPWTIPQFITYQTSNNKVLNNPRINDSGISGSRDKYSIELSQSVSVQVRLPR